ncbi:MAG: IgGFc-binding protein, partial [Polyangiaceae bacterium]|nr:IgGFc-binding protein [Polyangiaceae bacterium]
GTPKGVPMTYSMMKGQSLTFEQEAELTGSPILSTKPVGVIGASGCINIDACCCDGAHQQIPPVRALGSEYVAVRYRNRIDGMEENAPWRIVGAVDGTVLTYEPAPPMDAPLMLNSGQIAAFRSPGPFVVRSQDDDHPFYLSGYMTGGGDFNGAGDPEFVTVIPAKQYLAEYVFFADPTYPETNLVIVRTKASDGTFKDVNLDCAGVLGGFQPLGNSGNYEYTRFDLVRFNFEKQGNCDNGRREMHSDAPFGLTVWGWGTSATDAGGFTSTYVSYAYPAGASVQPINEVVVPPVPK